MKIIKGPDPWVRQLGCTDKECDTSIEITQEDIRSGYFGGDYIERGDKYYYVKCPTCGKALILHKLPERVTIEVDKRMGH